MKIILVLLSLFFSTHCWIPVAQYFFDPTQTANEILADWTHDFPPSGPTTYDCGGQLLAGGYCISNDEYLQLVLNGLDPHTRMRLVFVWYAIDTWDYNWGDKFLVKTDNVPQYTWIADNTWEWGDICGDRQYRDAVKLIDIDFPHTNTNTAIQFTAISTENACNESWGMHSLQIYIDKCPEGHIQFGDDCIPRDFVNDCFEHLLTIRPPDSPRPGILNDCKAEYDEEGNIYYHLWVQYQPPYVHDPECFDHEIVVEQTHLNFDPPLGNNWTFDNGPFPGGQDFNFILAHNDLLNYYGCDYVEDPVTGEIKWICDIYLHIYFQGQLVFTYHFKLCITANMKLVNTDDFIVLIEIYHEDDCCDLEIRATSELRFCNDPFCNSYSVTDPHLVPWNPGSTQVIVEQRVVEASFQSHFLNLQSILVNGIVPAIDFTNNDITGKLIIGFSGPYFLGSYNVEVISHLSITDTMLRLLEEEGEEVENAYVQDEKFIQVVGGAGEDSDQSDETKTVYIEKEEGGTSPVWPIVGGVAIFLVLTVIFANIACYLKKKKKQVKEVERKYQRKSSTSSTERDNIAIDSEA